MTGGFDDERRVIERWDRVFGALVAEPRRQLVVSLLETEPTEAVSLPEAAVNPDLSTDPERLRTELYHTHLPLLAEHGFVRWGTDPLRARRGPRFEEVGVVLDSLHRAAGDIPDSLVVGCRRLEAEREDGSRDG